MDHIQPVSGGQFFKGDGQCGGVIVGRASENEPRISSFVETVYYWNRLFLYFGYDVEFDQTDS